MARSGGRYKRRRTRLFNENPHCPFCGVLMVLPESLPDYGPRIKVFPDNLCTIEHLFSKLNPEKPKQGKTMICCKKCNEDRARAEESKLSIEEKQQRANHRGHRFYNWDPFINLLP